MLGRKVVAAALLVLVAVPLTGPTRAVRAQSPRPKTPARTALIVTANLEEAFEKRDNANSDDMVAFADRLKTLPYAPDILLLQEVSGTTVEKVARLVAKTMGRRFVVAVKPGETWTYLSNKTIKRETGIVINADTYKRWSRGGFVSVSYRARDAAPRTIPSVKKIAHALVRRRDGSLTLPVASVHFVKESYMKSLAVSEAYRWKWSKKVATRLANVYRHDNRRVIGGDFNSPRAKTIDGDRKILQFWARLTGDEYRFTDAVHSLTDFGGVDYIFTRAATAAAGKDQSNVPYSDHRFRWALIGGWGPETVTAEPVSTSRVNVSWTDVPYETSYKLQMSTSGTNAWEPVATTPPDVSSASVDDLVPSTQYHFRVVAVNPAGPAPASRPDEAITDEDVLPPSAPTAVRAYSVGTNKVRLTWAPAEDPDGKVVGYEIWRQRPYSGFAEVASVAASPYYDADVMTGSKYTYYVIARDHVDRRSEPSATAATVVGVK